MNSTEIIVLGINGNCIDIAEAIDQIAQAGGAQRMRGFLDDDPSARGRSVAGYPVLGAIADAGAGAFAEAQFVNGIGSPRSFRAKPGIIQKTGLAAGRWATVIHPSATVSPSARLGAGTVLLAQAVLGANVRVGDHVMILPHTVISHDTRLGSYSAVASGVCISGGCVIGDNCYLGSHCVLREGVTVGEGALIGMGSVVLENVAAGTVVAGNPARVLAQAPA